MPTREGSPTTQSAALPGAGHAAIGHICLTQDVLSSASIYKDLWTQVIDPSRTANGFQVQLQSDDDNDHGLSGFDW